MWELADQLLGQMEKNCTAEQFVLTILEKSNVYSLGEVNKVQNMLEKLQNPLTQLTVHQCIIDQIEVIADIITQLFNRVDSDMNPCNHIGLFGTFFMT